MSGGEDIPATAELEIELSRLTGVAVEQLLDILAAAHQIRKLTSGDRGWMTAAQKVDVSKRLAELSTDLSTAHSTVRMAATKASVAANFK